MSLLDTETFYAQPNVDASNNNNAATDIEGGERFFLKEMDINIDASQLTLPGGSDTVPFTADCWANLKIPVSYARNLFQYQTDAVDVNDLNSEDVQFRMFNLNGDTGDISNNVVTYYNSKNVIPSQADTYFNRIQYYGSDANAMDGHDDNKVDADMCRYIGKETFGIANTDIFNNELEVRLDITKESALAYNNRIQELKLFKVTPEEGVAPDYVRWNDVVADPDLNITAAIAQTANYFPTKEIYKQLLNNVRSRFADINTSTDAAKTTNNLIHLYDDDGIPIPLNIESDLSLNTAVDGYGSLWRKLPLLPGDMLFFNMTINPDANQTKLTPIVTDGVTSYASIDERSYRIRLEIVADAATGIQYAASDKYVRAWDAAGYNTSASLPTAPVAPTILPTDPAPTVEEINAFNIAQEDYLADLLVYQKFPAYLYPAATGLDTQP